MDFNEMNRNLEGGASREQRVRELMEKLMRRGLAMTKESARQLAESMVQTEERVQKTFQDRKDNVTSYNDPRSKDSPVVENAKGPGFMTSQYADEAKRANSDAMRKRAQASEPVNVQTHFDTPENDKGWVQIDAPEEPRDAVAEASATEAPEARTPEPRSPELDMGMPVTAAVEDPVPEHPTTETPVMGEPETRTVDDEVVSGGEVEPENGTMPERASAPEEGPVTVEPETAAEEPGPETSAPAMETAEPATDEAAEDDAAESPEHEAAVEPEAPSQEMSDDEADMPEAEPVEPEPEQPEEPQKEDLAEKHGIDLSNMFNVNK